MSVPISWADLDAEARLTLTASALKKHNGNVTKAARAIRVHRTQLSRFVSENAERLGLVCTHCKSRLKSPVETAQAAVGGT